VGRRGWLFDGTLVGGGMGDLESCKKAPGVYVYYLKIRS